jgi:hypothetical protein
LIHLHRSVIARKTKACVYFLYTNILLLETDNNDDSQSTKNNCFVCLLRIEESNSNEEKEREGEQYLLLMPLYIILDYLFIRYQFERRQEGERETKYTKLVAIMQTAKV